MSDTTTALNLPLDVESFLGAVRWEMSEALTLLDGSPPKNPHVKILQKGHGWIALSSLDAQPEPVNLSELKSEILKRWPMTSLLDMLKETDLRTDFSKAFKSATGRELWIRQRCRSAFCSACTGLAQTPD